MSRTATITRWWCERCDAGGVIEVPGGEDVYGGVERLQEAHDARGNNCEFGLSWVRIEPENGS